MRCWALAEVLERRGFHISWQGDITVPWVVGALAARNWRVIQSNPYPPSNDAAQTADVVVIDSYTLGFNYRQSLLDQRLNVVVIVDDHHQALGPGTLWVNPGVPTKHSSSPRYLNGLDYLLLRDEIRALRELRESQLLDSSITILLGGTDFADLRSLVDQLSPNRPTWAGPGWGRNPNITWLGAGSELLRRAALSSCVIAGAGVSSWEMLYIGTPLALYCATDNQQGNYSWMTDAGLAIPLGTSDDLRNQGMFESAFNQIAEWILESGNSTVSGIDGLGAERVADAIAGL